MPDAVVVGAGPAARFALARLDAGRYVCGDHRDSRSVQGGRRAARRPHRPPPDERSSVNILATSSGGFLPDDRYGARPGPLVRHAVELSGAASTPKVCALHTATGDDAARRAGWYAAVAGAGWRPSHLALFPMPNVDVRGHLLDQDVVWVGGGSVANLLALWRLHGLDEVLRAAWQAGVVLTGGSAGSLCWFEGGTTDSFGPQLRPVTNGLAFLPGSTCPHYDSEERRRPLYRSLVRDGAVPPGIATDDGVGLHFTGTELTAVLSDRATGSAWRVDRDGETELEPQRLRT